MAFFSLKRAAEALANPCPGGRKRDREGPQGRSIFENEPPRVESVDGARSAEGPARSMKLRVAHESTDVWTRMNADVVLQGGYDVKGVRVSKVCRGWHLGEISTREIAEWKDSLALGSPNLQSNISLLSCFRSFCQQPSDAKCSVVTNLMLFLSRGRIKAGLEYSTLAVYGQTIQMMLSAEGEWLSPHKSEMAAYEHYMAGVHLKAAAAFKLKARQISFEEGVALFNGIRHREDVRYSVFWLINTGARAEDILRVKNFKYDAAIFRLSINFDVAKNVRNAAEGQQVRIFLRLRHPGCEQRLMNQEVPVAGEAAINPVLFAVAMELGWKIVKAAECRANEDLGHRSPTTYSFRHLFIMHLIETLSKQSECGETVNWSEVIQLTGHQSTKTVRAAYGRSL